jgi:hypothetical protein
LTGNATEEAAKQVKDYGSSAASAAKDVVVLTEKQKAMAAAISSAQTVVKGAIDDFNAYKTKIAEGVFSGFDFAAALDVVKEKGTNLVDVLVAQAERASEFGRKMSQLLAAGLNRTSYDQVIAMGAERGTDVADAFINGNIQEAQKALVTPFRRTNTASRPGLWSDIRQLIYGFLEGGDLTKYGVENFDGRFPIFSKVGDLIQDPKKVHPVPGPLADLSDITEITWKNIDQAEELVEIHN